MTHTVVLTCRRGAAPPRRRGVGLRRGRAGEGRPRSSVRGRPV